MPWFDPLNSNPKSQVLVNIQIHFLFFCSVCVCLCVCERQRAHVYTCVCVCRAVFRMNSPLLPRGLGMKSSFSSGSSSLKFFTQLSTLTLTHTHTPHHTHH